MNSHTDNFIYAWVILNIIWIPQEAEKELNSHIDNLNYLEHNLNPSTAKYYEDCLVDVFHSFATSYIITLASTLD